MARKRQAGWDLASGALAGRCVADEGQRQFGLVVIGLVLTWLRFASEQSGRLHGPVGFVIASWWLVCRGTRDVGFHRKPIFPLFNAVFRSAQVGTGQ